MDVHQLTYFVAVAEESNFSRAAVRVGIAQPSLSQQVQKLEREVGQPLFDRLTRGVCLTEAGRILLEHARRVLTEIEDAKKHVSDASINAAGTLTIGAIPTIAPFLLPQVLAAYAKECPDVRLRIYENTSAVLARQLEDGALDAAVMSTFATNHTLNFERVAVEPLLLLLPAKHRLVKSSTIQWSQLKDERFLSLSEVHCLGSQVNSFCEQSRVNPPVVMEGAQLATIAELVAAGVGVSVVPKMMARGDRSKKRVYREFTAAPPTREIHIVTSVLRYRTQAVRRFVKLLKGLAGEL